MAVNWIDLNKDLLEVIGRKVDSYADYLRFRSVCGVWRDSLLSKPKRLPQQYPYLFLPTEYDDLFTISLLNPLNCEIVDRIELPEPRDNLYFRGFSKGWLIAIQHKGSSIYLINARDTDDHQKRLLPPIHTFPDVREYRPDKVGEEFVIYQKPNLEKDRICNFDDMSYFFVKKIVLSSSAEDYIAMAIWGEGCNLAYCRSGDNRWTKVNEQHGGFGDIIFYKDKFYAVGWDGEMVVISNFVSSHTIEVIATPMLPPVNMFTEWYLSVVEESSSEFHLLLAARDIEWFEDDGCYYQTTDVEIYKLILDPGSSSEGKWSTKLESLDNRILFLGGNESQVFSSSNFPECNADHVYFADNFYEGHDYDVNTTGSDLVMFNVKDNIMERFHGYGHPRQLCWPLSLWVMRNI